MTSMSFKVDNLKIYLQKSAANGNWEKVIKKYAKNTGVHWLKVTEAGDTALHLACYDGQEAVVEKLVRLIQNKEVLKIKNKKGNTPLHLAAETGNVRNCHIIASMNELLVDEKNNDRETPLFIAAIFGNKDAFYCLYHFCKMDLNRFLINCRRKYGETILHTALKTEQFDFAFQLINMSNKMLGYSVDEEGIAPLHVLATKPSAFKSGSHMGLWQRILYYCIHVDQLIPESAAPTRTQAGKNMSNAAASFPPIAFFTNLWESFLILSRLKQVFKKKEDLKDEAKDTDLENEAIESYPPPLDTQLQKPGRWSWNTLYGNWIKFLEIIILPIWIILGYGCDEIKKLRKEKQKHTWAIQVMEELLETAYIPFVVDEEDEDIPMLSNLQTDEETLPYTINQDSIPEFIVETDEQDVPKWRTPILVAAKYGVVEIVNKVFEKFPQSIRDIDSGGKNMVHLAAKYRHAEVYKFLLHNKKSIQTLFRASDKKGNTALHYAAHVRGHDKKPWRVTGPALQLHSEIKWYRFVEDSMENQLFVQYNNEGKLAKNIFNEKHQKLLESGQEWLVRTSESCSLLAALITTVAFASATTVPGGNSDSGTSPLERETGFFIFAISSLIALCLSTTSVVAFLSILNSKFEKEDFSWKLPVRLLIGLSSLFFSIVAMLVSFCAGHYFMLSHRLQNMVVIAYIATALPVALFFAIVQIHLYQDLLVAILSNVPT